MKRAPLFLLAALWTAAACAPCSADIIEVRGKGMIDGEIVSETESELTFRNPWGEVATYAKKDVLYVERAEPAPAKKSEPKKPAPAKKAPRPELGSGLAPSPFAADGESAFVERIRRTFLEFWAGDADEIGAVAGSAVGDAMHAKRTLGANRALCLGGMLLIVAGLLGTAVFGLQLVIAAFEESFVWGFTLVANVLAYYAPMFDGLLQVLFYAPQAATLFFFVKKWGLVRGSVVAQILSVNLGLLGFWMMKASMS